MPPSFDGLFEDILLDIFSFLNVIGLLRVKRTCRTLYNVIEDNRSVWHNVIRGHLLPMGISLPIPSDVPLDELSIFELKMAAIIASRLDFNWRSAQPNPSRWLEMQTETPSGFVQTAFLLPGTAGRYLVTITKGSQLSIFEIQPGFRRCIRIGTWLGAFLDVVHNSDCSHPATIAISRFSDEKRMAAVCNVSIRSTGSPRVSTAELKELSWFPIVGRLKCLRGNLAVFYDRSTDNVLVVNCVTGVQLALRPNAALTPALRPTRCLAIEILPRCIIVVRSPSVDIYDLPDIVKECSPFLVKPDLPLQDPIDMYARTSWLCPDTEDWLASAIVPYCPPYPSLPTNQPETISLLMRSKPLRISHPMIHHYRLSLPPYPLSPPYVLAPGLTMPLPEPLQTRQSIRSHFFYDLVVSPTSGRGIWLENATEPGMSHSSEKLLIFGVDPETGEVDIGQGDTSQGGRGLDDLEVLKRKKIGAPRQGQVRSAATRIPEVVRTCSYASFDDSVGRVVIATHDGHVRVLDMGL